MKTILALIVALVLVFPVATSAQVEVSIDVFTRYIANPGFIPHDDPVVQTNVFVPLPKGFSFDIWMSTGTDFKPNFGREIDVILGWSDKLFGVGLSYYDLNNILSTKTTDIVLPFAEVHPTLTSNNHKFTTFARVEYNFCTRQSNVNSAVDLAVGMKHVWQINKVFSVNHRLRVAYYDGLFASKSGFVTRWDVGLSAKMTKQVNLNLSVKNSIPERSMTDRQNLTSFGIGVSSSFP